MRKYHYIYALLIIFLLIFGVFLVIKYNRTNTQIKLVTNKINKFDQYYKLMEWREREAILNNGTKLSPDLTIVDENKNPVTLVNILKENDNSIKMIIRYSALACDICMEEELKQISNHVKQMDINDVLIFASNHNIRSLRIIRETLPFRIKVYQIEDTGIPFETENENLFIFTLNKDCIVKDFFIPEKTLPKLSDNYYEIVFKKYWQILNQ